MYQDLVSRLYGQFVTSFIFPFKLEASVILHFPYCEQTYKKTNTALVHLSVSL